MLMCLAGCGKTTARYVSIAVVDRDGQSPPIRGAGQVHFGVLQDGAEIVETDGLIAGGKFDVSLGIESYGTPTRIQAELSSDTLRLFGSIPTFIPALTAGARIVVGEPGTCAPLSQPQLTLSRVDGAFVGVEANLFLLGGVRPDVDESVDVSEAIVGTSLTTASALTAEWIAPLASAPRQSRAIQLGVDRIVLVSEQAALRIDVLTPSVETLSVHSGANQNSALVATDAGVAIVGGGTESQPASGITWVPYASGPTQTALAVPRFRPAAGWVGGVLVVAGGQRSGESRFEQAARQGDGVAFGDSTAALAEPIAVRDAAATRIEVLGGTLADGTVSGSSVAVLGCPACRVESGSAAFEPRRRPMVVETKGGTWLLGGEGSDGTPLTIVERAIFDENGLQIYGQGPLDVARTGGSATELASGIVLVAGGTNGSVGLRTLTICWPDSELDTLR